MFNQTPSTSINLRAFAGRFPTGVAVITTRDNTGKCFGITMSAVTSLSLNPPLFLICLNNNSNTLAAINNSGHFCINFLSSHQAKISKIFASKEDDKFRSVEYAIGTLGSPLIKGSVAHGECKVQTTHVGGDHTIIIACVEHIALHDAEPLVYHRGSYASLAEFQVPA